MREPATGGRQYRGPGLFADLLTSSRVYRITVEEDAGAVVIRAAGELDAYAAPELTAALDQTVTDRLVADLTAVSFLDSTALGSIVRTVRDRADEGRETRVVLPLGTARRIFEITTLDRALPVSASLRDALAELS